MIEMKSKKKQENKSNVLFHPECLYSETPNESFKLHVLQFVQFDEPQRRTPCVLLVQEGPFYLPSLVKLAKKGYTIALVELRANDRFPNVIYDIKEAVRYMKKNANTYNIDPEKMVLMGGEAAVLAGFTSLSHRLDQSEEDCQIHAIIDLYGKVEPSQEEVELDEEAHRKCCKNYLFENFGPILIVHGKEDPIVPIEQSARLYKALKKANKETQMIILEKEGHGGPAFWSKKMRNHYDRFIKSCFQK